MRVPEAPVDAADIDPAVSDTYRHAERVGGETVATMAAEFGWRDCTGHHRRAAGGVADSGLNHPELAATSTSPPSTPRSVSDFSPVRVENCRPAPTCGYRRPRSRHKEEHEE